MNIFKRNIFRIIAEEINVTCNQITTSGGSGVTEYVLTLDNPLGGIIIMDFDSFGVPDKLEIIHDGLKKATTGMTVPNSGTYDNLYGDPTIPTLSEANATDQFIGTDKGVIPTRDSEFLTDTGITDVVRTRQQLIWWVYTSTNYTETNSVTIRITGSGGTDWSLKRLCTGQTPIGI